MKKIYAVVAFESGEAPSPMYYCVNKEDAIYACEKLNAELSHYSMIEYFPLTYTIYEDREELEREFEKCSK